MDYKHNYEVLERELNYYHITIYDYPFTYCSNNNAMTVVVNGKHYIGINSNKEFTYEERYWLIQHELEHIKHGAFYHINDDGFVINRNERITNDAVLEKTKIIYPVLLSRINGACKEETCSSLNIPYKIYDMCIDYDVRRMFSKLKNRVELLCHQNDMDALVLSKRLGCTESEAQDIMNESKVIKYEYIKRLCEIFQVSQEYLLCM